MPEEATLEELVIIEQENREKSRRQDADVQIALLPSAATVRFGHRKVSKPGLPLENAFLVTAENFAGLVFRPRDFRLPPAARSPTVLVLD